MKKMRPIHFVFMVLAILMPIILFFVGIYIYAVNLPHAYKASYYAALPLKYDRLQQTESTPGRVVVIGGSSVAFGIDSKLVEKELGMPCVNFGLYAAFGFKPMLDLSIGKIRQGDIVVLAPELSSQMYSDYIGYEYLMEAMEGRSDMAFSLGLSYNKGFLSQLSDYAKSSKELLENPSNASDTVYAYSSFDEYGDIIYQRAANIMEGMYSQDNLPEISVSMITDSFVDMINQYVSAATQKGAKVYWGFCPINELSVSGITKEAQEKFVNALRSRLHCEILSSLSDHILPAGYFYDSNFHANDAGVIANSVLLINDIKRVTANMTLTATAIPAPLSGTAGDVISSGSTEEFTYDLSTKGITITGLTDKGLSLSSLQVPEEIEGYAVIAISGRAFENAQVSSLELPKTITSLGGAIFANAVALTEVKLYSTALPEVGNSLLTEANDAIKIYVPADLYGIYTTDYFWGTYGDHIDKLPD